MPVPTLVDGVIDEFIQARHVWPRSTTSIRHFGIHTPEGPEMPRYARSLGYYFRALGADRVASTHFGCDSELTVRYAGDEQICAGAKGVNTSGIHIEIAGVAAQTADQWLDDFSRKALYRAAAVFGLYRDAYDIPPVLLTAAELLAGKPGIVKHSVAWAAYGGDYRSDPGHHFPDDLFLAMCRGEEETPVLTPQFVRTGWRSYPKDPATFEFVRSSLAVLDHDPGPKGQQIDRAIARFKRTHMGRTDPNTAVGEDMWQALFRVLAGVEPATVEVPDPKAAQTIAQLEQDLRAAEAARSQLAAKVDAARAALR